MSLNSDSLEIRDLRSWLGHFPKSPKQTHNLNESDAEIVKLKSGFYLASTVDSVSEEIAFGLYQDPYTAGWVAAMAALSDLAAVGADPLGVLLSSNWAEEFTIEKKTRVALGIRNALKKTSTHLLGGDSGKSVSTVLTLAALGLCDSKPLSRLGLKEGDWICVTGHHGVGPALGFRHLLGDAQHWLEEEKYRPIARLKEGMRLRKLVSCSMDTSDGLAVTLNTLSKLNGVGFEFGWDQKMFHPEAIRYCRLKKFPLSSLWFGEHGDFQLVLGVSRENLGNALARVPDLRVLGKAVPRKQGTTMSGKPFRLNLLADLPKNSFSEIRSAFDLMIEYLRRECFP